MKIALAQINPTIGDIEGNLLLIRAAVDKAKAAGADLCVLPEMAITGYPPHDLLDRAGFIDRNLRALNELAADTRNMGVIVGYVRPNRRGVGKPLENAAALLADGGIVSTHAKALLPTYDVFDERRYFEPAGGLLAIDFRGFRLGITICEDIWNSAESMRSGLYERDPVRELVSQGAQVIINVSASPFTLQKRQARPAMLAEVARQHGRQVVFVNQVGGNDELIFDGQSMAFDENGNIIARAREFGEDLVLADLATACGDMRSLAANDEAAVIDALALGTRDYALKCGFKSAAIGLSGGIDSALVACIAARALGPQNVLGVTMPTRYSSPGSISDSAALAHNLGIGFEQVPIDDVFQGFLERLEPLFAGRAPDAAEENVQARVRGVILMALSNKLGHLLLTTGNKSELATGYCTLYGDMAGGLAVLADVPKTLVYRLAREINREGEVIPHSTLTKPPSAELRPDQKDEDSLPPYDVLDAIVERLVDQGKETKAVIAEGFDEETVRFVARLVRNNEYKRRQAPPGLKITSKAFGLGRRMPLAQRWPG